MQLNKSEGYVVGEAPLEKEANIESGLNDPEAKISSLELNAAYRMSTEEYYGKTLYATDLGENRQPAPGILNTDGKNLVINRKDFGNVFIGLLPSFEYGCYGITEWSVVDACTWERPNP